MSNSFFNQIISKKRIRINDKSFQINLRNFHLDSLFHFNLKATFFKIIIQFCELI